MERYIPLALAVILAIFLIQAVSLNFIQDDAFISYRYVKNFVNGHGLVFNPGERVEGYTNFLWIILLSLFTVLGVNTILASKILGLASGCAVLVLLYEISSRLLSHPSKDSKHISGTGASASAQLMALAPSLLLAANGAFAYWSISGLEMSFFVMAVLLSVYFYFTSERLMILSCAVCSLIRPEGVLIFAIIMAHKFFLKKDGIRATLLYLSAFGALLLPYLAFKVSYYGDLLPNPFYAKTGLSWEYVQTGLAYFWQFLKQYGLWGLLYIITVPLYGKISTEGHLILILVWVWTLYVIAVGGDVLLGHRFFLPMLPFLYFLVSKALLCFSQQTKKAGWLAWPALALALVTFLLPRQWLLDARRSEIGLCTKMAISAARFENVFGRHYTLAASTIGAISYYGEAIVIDMLGLTDRFIARHPEEIPGIFSPWKERRFNTQYLLSRDPDAILFSTGMKPSAPAERALFLNSKFRENYYPYYFPEGHLLQVIYRRKANADKEVKNCLFPDATFANLFNEAMNLESSGHLQAAAQKVDEIIRIGPPDFAWAYDKMASLQFLMQNGEQAKRFALQAVAMDDYCILSHFILKNFYEAQGDSAAARREHLKIQRYNPEFLQLMNRRTSALPFRFISTANYCS